jgi:hypothetical protein
MKQNTVIPNSHPADSWGLPEEIFTDGSRPFVSAATQEALTAIGSGRLRVAQQTAAVPNEDAATKLAR